MPLPVDVALLADVSMNALDATLPRGRMSARSRTSAFAGSRIRFRDHDLLVVWRYGDVWRDGGALVHARPSGLSTARSL